MNEIKIPNRTLPLTFQSLAIIVHTTRFKIKKKFYMVLPLGISVLHGSHNKQRLLLYTSLAYWFCITEVENVYCAVRTESLYKTDTFNFLKS